MSSLTFHFRKKTLEIIRWMSSSRMQFNFHASKTKQNQRITNSPNFQIAPPHLPPSWYTKTPFNSIQLDTQKSQKQENAVRCSETPVTTIPISSITPAQKKKKKKRHRFLQTNGQTRPYKRRLESANHPPVRARSQRCFVVESTRLETWLRKRSSGGGAGSRATA